VDGVKVTAHAFDAGQAGTYQEIYCQAPPQPGTDPVPGVPRSVCGWLESAHTMTAAQEAESDDALVQRLVLEIGGWAA
jgi:hypothetical protein